MRNKRKDPSSTKVALCKNLVDFDGPCHGLKLLSKASNNSLNKPCPLHYGRKSRNPTMG